MRKFTNLSLKVESLTLGGQSLLRVHVTRAALPDWSICLQLLQENLVEAVGFRRLDSSDRIEIYVVTGSQSSIASDMALDG